MHSSAGGRSSRAWSRWAALCLKTFEVSTQATSRKRAHRCALNFQVSTEATEVTAEQIALLEQVKIVSFCTFFLKNEE